jgi:transcriptional regulator with XRE-family HTH domain
VPKAPHPFLKRLGARIRDLRAGKHFSQEAFADRVGLDRSYMSGIERGIRNFSVLNLAKIAKALGVPVSSLFDKES